MAAEEQAFSEKKLNAILDRLIQGKGSEEIMGPGGVVKDLTLRLVERVLEGKMTAHLGYEKHAQEGRDGHLTYEGEKNNETITT
jgi:putative transposase